MRPLFDYTLNTEQKDIIMKEIGTNEDKMKKNKEDLRQWVQHQHHFPQVKIGDKFLESFIVGCKGNLDKSKSKLDAYFTCRAKYPNVFTKRDPTDNQFLKYAKVQPFITLNGRTLEGYRIHVTWLDGSEYDVTSWMKRVISQWEILLRSEPWSAGEIFLISGANFTFAHAAKLSPNDVATMFSLAQNVYPLRIKGIWFYNAPPACDFIVNKILKPIISKKISDRIQVDSGDHSILLKHFSSKILPEDYGGQSYKLNDFNDKWLEKLAEYKNWFKDEGEMITDETKRPSGTVDSFGCVTGSFKKLQID